LGSVSVCCPVVCGNRRLRAGYPLRSMRERNLDGFPLTLLFPSEHPKSANSNSIALVHVAAYFAAIKIPSLRTGYFSYAPSLLLFRKRSRPAYLLGCKRPRNGSLSQSTFCGLRLRCGI